MKIGVLTSGGDAPGMNAAIRAVVRTALRRGWSVAGVRNGFAGLIGGSFVSLGARDVGGIVERGGTFLGSARCPEFREEEGRVRALRHLRQDGIAGLVVIGGNGSQTGSHALCQMGFPVVGVASTIDNDLCGSDVTIGVDTALNIAIEAIDRLKVTASSHERAFLVEVMGRDCGYLALMAALAGGAEAVVLPEIDVEPDVIAADLRASYERGKAHAIVVVAEGARYDGEALVRYFREHKGRLGFEPRLTVLGHVQRGGRPGASDRLLATRLGAAAVEQLARGGHGVLVGTIDNRIQATPLGEVVAGKKTIDRDLLDLARTLAQ
ncbi:MAG: 6-phosphofructokinase [Deltaproteobacteria bacterium]|nr:6-phosphofructokinase [Deltaproteobacteria bacterium]